MNFASTRMAQLSMNEMTTFRWSFDEDVRHYVAAGYQAIGVWRRKLNDFGEERGIELLKSSRLRVSNLLWAGGFTGSTGHSFRESIQDAQEAIGLAAAIGAENLVVYSGPRNGHTKKHARSIFVDALRELLPEADRRGVTLAIEPMHPGCARQFTFLTCLLETIDLVKSFDHARIKLVFDTYQVGHDPEVLAHIETVAPHVGVVHLGDSRKAPNLEQDRHCLGEGQLPLKRIVQSLVECGYDGYYDVELLGEEIESADYRQLLTSSKDAFERFMA